MNDEENIESSESDFYIKDTSSSSVDDNLHKDIDSEETNKIDKVYSTEMPSSYVINTQKMDLLENCPENSKVSESNAISNGSSEMIQSQQSIPEHESNVEDGSISIHEVEIKTTDTLQNENISETMNTTQVGMEQDSQVPITNIHSNIDANNGPRDSNDRNTNNESVGNKNTSNNSKSNVIDHITAHQKELQPVDMAHKSLNIQCSPSSLTESRNSIRFGNFCLNCGKNLTTRQRDNSKDSSMSRESSCSFESEKFRNDLDGTLINVNDNSTEALSKRKNSVPLNSQQQIHHSKSLSLDRQQNNTPEFGPNPRNRNNSFHQEDKKTTKSKEKDTKAKKPKKQKAKIKSKKKGKRDSNTEESSHIRTVSQSIESPLENHAPIPFVRSFDSNSLSMEENTIAICEDCIDDCLLGLMDMSMELQTKIHQFDNYIKSLNENNSIDHQSSQYFNEDEEYSEDVEQLEREIYELQAEKEKLKHNLKAISSKDYSEEKMNIQIQVNILDTKMNQVTEDHCSSLRKKDYLVTQLAKLIPSHLINETFKISCDGLIGTINGFRLGRIAIEHVDWMEVNSALGQVIHLLYSVSLYRQFRFERISLLPRGAFSKIIKGGTTYELIGGASFTGFFRKNKRFEQALCLLLDATDQLCLEAERDLKEERPYKISNDMVGDFSIKYAEKTEEKWTLALKCLLVDLKFILLWVAEGG